MLIKNSVCRRGAERTPWRKLAVHPPGKAAQSRQTGTAGGHRHHRGLHGAGGLSSPLQRDGQDLPV